MTAPQSLWRPALAFAALGWREAAAEWPVLIARAGVFVLPILIFAAIWHATPLATLDLPSHDADHLIWYVTVTEVIVFAMAFPFRAVEDDIRLGHIEAGLTRPVPYTLAVLAEAAGGASFRFVALGVLGTALAFVLTQRIPAALASLPGLALVALLGCQMGVAFQVAVGFSTAWFGQSAPLFWIWQKALFLLGGLLLPLTIYPAVVAQAAFWTPFPAMLYLPAGLVLEDSAGAFARCLACQALWSVAILAALATVDRLAIGRLTREGV